MSDVKILTDSVAQVPPDLANKYQIGVIPFSIIIEEKSYKDGINLKPAEFYRRMRTETIVPRTSQPSLGEYLQFFEKHIIQGSESILYLSLPATLSGAFSTASKAAMMLEEDYSELKIAVIDTRTATIAQGFLAIKAAQAAKDGAKFETVVKLAKESRSKVGFVAMLETLFYLERGGRVGKAAYLAGSLINIKPIITIDNEGQVAPAGTIRGEKKCLQRLIECMENAIDDQALSQVAVMHADAFEKAEQLQQLAAEHFKLDVKIISDFTPVMGAHAGPGVLGLAYALK
jgi:DegV family protein with EDD domain